MVNYEILLDVKDSKVLETDIVLTQGDNTAVKFTIRVMNDGAAMTPSTAKIAFLSGGNVIAGDLSISGSVLTYVFQGNEITVPGRESATVVLTDSSGRVSAKAFVFEVAYNPLLAPSTPAGSYIPEIEEIISQAEEMIAALQADFPSAPLMKADILNAFTQSASGLYALDAVAGKTLYDNLSHRNLIDNGWFTVNQRGQSSYSGSQGYCVDRWFRTYNSTASGNSVEVTANGLNGTKGSGNTFLALEQKFESDVFEKLVGKTCTISVLLNGTIYSHTFIVTNGTVEENISANPHILLRSVYSDKKISIRFYADFTNLRAIKLELGSVSTLANDTAPDYAEELLKCQRYCFVIDSYAFPLAIGTVISSNTVRFTFVCPVEMRISPSVSFTGIQASNFNVYCDGSVYSLTGFPSVINRHSNQIYLAGTCSTSISFGQTALLRTDGTTGKIIFSSDL